MQNQVKALLLATVLLSGCATFSEVEPTMQELNAVSQFKKTVAVIGFDDYGSPIRNVGELVTASFESMLYKQFNLVDRNQINTIMAERNFQINENPARMAELGQMLGVDYLIFGSVTTSYEEPRQQHSSNTDRKGRFNGYIWYSEGVRGQLTIKMVNVATGVVAFTDTVGITKDQVSDQKNYDIEEDFNRNLDYRSHRQGDRYNRYERINMQLVRQTIDEIVDAYRSKFVRQFPQTGQIIEKLSETEVLVNLGSAYNVKPGDRLFVYPNGEADPRSGLSMRGKYTPIILVVHNVTSGVSSIAKGRKADIYYLPIGAEVTTQGGR